MLHIDVGGLCNRKGTAHQGRYERLLREIVESPYWVNWQVRRAKVILERAAGASIKELVQKLRFSRASIRRTCLTYARQGLAGLMTQKQITGGPRRYFEKVSSNPVLNGAEVVQPVSGTLH